VVEEKNQEMEISFFLQIVEESLWGAGVGQNLISLNL